MHKHYTVTVSSSKLQQHYNTRPHLRNSYTVPSADLQTVTTMQTNVLHDIQFISTGDVAVQYYTS